jgi:Zn-dependent metalloprotease
MKKMKLFILLTLFLSITRMYAQEGVEPCANFNSFLQSNQNISILDSIFGGRTTKTGIIEFDIEKSIGFGLIEDHQDLFNIDSYMTFAWIDERQSRFSKIRYDRYQQYYKGVKVVGGGYSRVVPIDPGGNPCVPVMLLSLRIYNNINMDVEPSVKKEGIERILANRIGGTASNIVQNDPNLEILCDSTTNCQPILTWKIYFNDNNEYKFGWLNAMDGQIVKIAESNHHLTAPTADYGVQSLNDLSTKVGSITTTKLISPDEKIRVYNMSGVNDEVSIGNFTESIIPQTTSSSLDATIAAPDVYQAFYVLQRLAPVLKSLEINYDVIHCGADMNIDNSFALESPNGNFKDFYIAIGKYQGTGMAFYDVIGHELAHCYMFQFGIPSGGAIHEGIADMVGTYLESVVQGTTDWLMGDTRAIIAYNFALERDLSNPEYDCVDDDLVHNISLTPYQRSEPMKYWFYLISEGDPQKEIPAIGIETATKIVLDAVSLLGAGAFYEELRDATLSVAKLEFGACSPEYKAIRKAWQIVCLDVPPNECFSLVGDDIVCEETNSLQVYAQGGSPNSSFRWYFPIAWSVVGNPVGNVLEGENPLIVTNIPQYSYYPRYFKIKCLNLTTYQTSTMFVKVEDCDGDDVSCEEYYSIGRPALDTPTTAKETSLDRTIVNNSKVIVTDLLGRILYRGSAEEFFQDRFPFSSSPLILLYLDESERVIKKRIINIKND